MNSRIRRRSPGSCNSHRLDVVVDGQADEHGADRLAVLFGRTGDAGDREADVRIRAPAARPTPSPPRPAPRPPGPRARRARRTSPRSRSSRSSPGRSRSRPATSVSRAPIRPPVIDSASPSVRPCASSKHRDGVLHGLVVDAEHELTEQRAQLGFLGRRAARARSASSAAFAVMRTFKPSIPLARNASVGLPVRSSASIRSAEQLGEARLALAPRAQHPAHDHRRLAGPRPEVRDDRGGHDRAHLVRHAGHRVDHLVADRTDQARRRARLRIVDRARARPAPRPGAGCWQPSTRPRDANIRSIRAATSSSSSSGTPMTSAIASRVMSSCVGPRPPHTTRRRCGRARCATR